MAETFEWILTALPPGRPCRWCFGRSLHSSLGKVTGSARLVGSCLSLIVHIEDDVALGLAVLGYFGVVDHKRMFRGGEKNPKVKIEVFSLLHLHHTLASDQVWTHTESAI